LTKLAQAGTISTMRRLAQRLASVLVVCSLAWAPAARGADATPEQLQFAAQEHDLGYRAYVAKQFEEAGTHFENAFFAAPNPAELRSAIRARRDAGQNARAATLASIGKRKYADDVALGKLADETIAAARPKVYEVHVTSAEECNAAVDAKVVAAEKATDFRFFVDPGHHDLLVGWSDDRSSKVAIDATAGGTRELSLPPPPHPVKKPHAPIPVATPTSSKPFGPAVFIVGLGLTAAAGGVTIWSGIDTLNNPGPNAVKADCVGQTTSCAAYQQGLSSQLRTNVLIGVTGGLGLVTAVVGIFFTQWSHPDARAAEHPADAAFRVTPLLGPGEAALVGTF
jgi:hypothetical protein